MKIQSENKQMQPSIFISSTFYDLKYVREELGNFIQEKGYNPVMNERGDIGYSSSAPLDESCYESMSNCHMAIIIIGGEYGSAATGETNDKFNEFISITRKEFKSALDAKKEIFVFIVQDVLSEYSFYKDNKNLVEENRTPINFKATKNVNVFRFIEQIYDLNIPTFGFTEIGQIKSIMEKQWADMLRKYLSGQILNKSVDPDSNASELLIEGEWISVFVEQNKILNENIIIKQQGRNIQASFELGNRKYEFEGKFKNRILMGEYKSTNKRNDERGNMMLKLIGDSILSGYITFVYKNEQVNTSPYVWVLKSKQDLTFGTYGFCSECVKVNRKCCCANEDVDMPILLPFEVDNICKAKGILATDFCEGGTQNIHQMKRKKIDGTDLQGCYFYNGDKCTIYEQRPIDCRLFPFDIAFIDGEYQLIHYNNLCRCGGGFSDSELAEMAHIVKPLISVMQPYLSESTFIQYNEKLRHHKYKVIKPLSKIF